MTVAPPPAAFGVPARLQRARGRVGLAFARREGATRLARLRQEGAGKARLPRVAPGAPPLAVLLNTAGGLAGGDDFAIEGEIGPGAAAALTTQACERVYRALDAPARVSTRLSLGPGARLDWLPQETILFDGGGLARRLEVDLAEDATLLAVEAVVLGRAAMGETVRRATFREDWRVRRGGRLLFADALRLEGEAEARAAGPATLDGARAIATILYVSPEAEAPLDAVRAALGAQGGASAWDGKLVARIVAPDGFGLRRALVPALGALMDGRELPRLWRL